MKLFLILTLLFSITAKAFHGGVPKKTFSLIPKFFKLKHLKFGVFFVCWKNRDTMRINKKMWDANISVLYLKSDLFSKISHLTDNSRTGIVVDLSCRNSKTFLEQGSKMNNFKNLHKWLIISDAPLAFSKEFFANLNLRIDSDVTYTYLNDSSDSESFLYDIYNTGYGLGGQMKYNRVGVYRKRTIYTRAKFSRYNQRKNMTGVKLKVGTVITRNISVSYEEYLQDRRKYYQESVSKLSYVLCKHLVWYHGFRQKVVIFDKWFGKTPQGNDSESLCQYKYQGKIDYSCMCTIIRPPRKDVLDFLKPIYHFRTSFIFRNPCRSGNVENEFLKPFDLLVWYILFISCFVIVIVLRTICWVEERIFRLYQENSWTNSILIILSTLCQQGSSFIPKHFSGRLVVFSLLILSLIIYNYYTSSIVSSLLSVGPSPWKTLAELAHSTLRLGIENIVYVNTLFEVTKDPDIQYLYRTKVFPPGNKHPFYYTPEEGIALVKKGGFAYHTEPSTGYPIVNRIFEPYQICELNEIHLIKPLFLYTMAPKNSQYNELFGVTYSRLIEYGIVKRERLVWQTEKPKCLANIRLSAVGINQTAPLLILLCAGMLSSLAILLCEIFIGSKLYKRIYKKIARSHVNCRRKH